MTKQSSFDLLAEEYLRAYDDNSGVKLDALRKKYNTGNNVLASLFQQIAERA